MTPDELEAFAIETARRISAPLAPSAELLFVIYDAFRVIQRRTRATKNRHAALRRRKDSTST